MNIVDMIELIQCTADSMSFNIPAEHYLMSFCCFFCLKCQLKELIHIRVDTVLTLVSMGGVMQICVEKKKTPEAYSGDRWNHLHFHKTSTLQISDPGGNHPGVNGASCLLAQYLCGCCFSYNKWLASIPSASLNNIIISSMGADKVNTSSGGKTCPPPLSK